MSALRGANLESNKHPDDVAILQSAGATLVRWQMWCPNADTIPFSEYSVWLDKEIETLNAATRDIKKVVCLFTPPGGKRFATSTYWQSRFVDTWRRLAKRTRANPSVWGYDLVNEPSMNSDSWWKLAKRVCKDLKYYAPNVNTIVTAKFGTTANLIKREPFRDGDYYTAHVYAPMKYTHQGIGENPYPVAYEPGGATKELQALKTWADKNKAKIFIGEFSAVRWAPGCERWLSEVTSFLAGTSFVWCYHSWRGAHNWDSELPANYDPHGNQQYEPRKPTIRFRVLESSWKS